MAGFSDKKSTQNPKLDSPQAEPAKVEEPKVEKGKNKTETDGK